MKWTKDTGLDERSCQAGTLMKGTTKMENVMARGSTGNSTSACIENQIYISIYTSIERTNIEKSGLCSRIDKQSLEECYVHMINDQNDLSRGSEQDLTLTDANFSTKASIFVFLM